MVSVNRRIEILSGFFMSFTVFSHGTAQEYTVEDNDIEVLSQSPMAGVSVAMLSFWLRRKRVARMQNPPKCLQYDKTRF